MQSGELPDTLLKELVELDPACLLVNQFSRVKLLGLIERRLLQRIPLGRSLSLLPLVDVFGLFADSDSFELLCARVDQLCLIRLLAGLLLVSASSLLVLRFCFYHVFAR